jgi:signal transduction histidine kinase
MLQDKRILTVDDSVSIRNYLRTILTRKGASVEVADTGADGLALWAGGEEYDLILLDLVLPDLNGIEVLQRIRRTDDETTVVVLTGLGGVKSAIAAVRHGADAFIEKQDIAAGRDPEEFFYSLEQALEHRAGIVAQGQLQEIKADFYSMVTHDLRNPAGAITTAIELLRDEGGEPLTPQQAEYVEIIEEAAEQLSSLINDYLDFAKIDAGYLRLNLDDVELGAMVEARAHFFRLQAQAKGQELVLDLPTDPVLAQADGERLQQVLNNLLSNAVKYTPQGGRITVQLRADDGQARLRVSDTGIGIQSDQMPALFAKFHRVPGEATRHIRGTGLGLLIAKEIVEGHGGTISVESEGVLGKGTTFTVTIPLKPPAE